MARPYLRASKVRAVPLADARGSDPSRDREGAVAFPRSATRYVPHRLAERVHNLAAFELDWYPGADRISHTQADRASLSGSFTDGCPDTGLTRFAGCHSGPVLAVRRASYSGFDPARN
jgi:hypothetical protein